MLVIVLVYSIVKVKSLFKQSYVQLNPNLKLLWFFVLLLVSYVFQYLIAYPLHVIHDEEESESSEAFARQSVYYMAACCIGYGVILIVHAIIVTMLIKFTHIRRQRHPLTRNLSSVESQILSERSMEFETHSNETQKLSKPSLASWDKPQDNFNSELLVGIRGLKSSDDQP